MIQLTTALSFLLMFEQKGAVSFGVYDVSRSLTIPGWIVVIALSLLIIFGALRLIGKIINKSKMK